MYAKNTKKKSPIHENAGANITCDFGDGDISRSRSRLTHTRTHGHNVSSIIVIYFKLFSDVTCNWCISMYIALFVALNKHCCCLSQFGLFTKKEPVYVLGVIPVLFGF